MNIDTAKGIFTSICVVVPFYMVILDTSRINFGSA